MKVLNCFFMIMMSIPITLDLLVKMAAFMAFHRGAQGFSGSFPLESSIMEGMVILCQTMTSMLGLFTEEMKWLDVKISLKGVCLV